MGRNHFRIYEPIRSRYGRIRYDQSLIRILTVLERENAPMSSTHMSDSNKIIGHIWHWLWSLEIRQFIGHLFLNVYSQIFKRNPHQKPVPTSLSGLLARVENSAKLALARDWLHTCKTICICVKSPQLMTPD